MRTPIETCIAPAATTDAPNGPFEKIASVTVVIPCYNEEVVVRSSFARLDACTRCEENVSWTFLFVDDGSSDRTWPILLDLRRADPRVRLIRLSRNFGHQSALAAGIDHAAADAVVVIDADLQDPPEVICQFVDRWKSGSDIVYGRRIQRDGEPMLRRFFTSTFYALANALTTIRLEPQVGDFYLLDRRVVSAVRRCQDQRPFLRGIVQWLGFTRLAVHYERQRRLAGDSKYTWAKLFALAGDCFLSFGMNPFPGVLTIAAFWFVVSLLILAASYGSDQFVSAVIAVMLGGQFLTLLALVLIGQFARAAYNRGSRRPAYVIDHLDPAYARKRRRFCRAKRGAARVETEISTGGCADE